jgi:hypothetical protein
VTSPAREEGRQKEHGSVLLKRVGVAGFLFFLVKGLLWLAIPAFLYLIG